MYVEWINYYYTSVFIYFIFFFSSRRRHTRSLCDWSSDVCSSDLNILRKVECILWVVSQQPKKRDVPRISTEYHNHVIQCLQKDSIIKQWLDHMPTAKNWQVDTHSYWCNSAEFDVRAGIEYQFSSILILKLFIP